MLLPLTPQEKHAIGLRKTLQIIAEKYPCEKGQEQAVKLIKMLDSQNGPLAKIIPEDKGTFYKELIEYQVLETQRIRDMIENKSHLYGRFSVAEKETMAQLQGRKATEFLKNARLEDSARAKVKILDMFREVGIWGKQCRITLDQAASRANEGALTLYHKFSSGPVASKVGEIKLMAKTSFAPEAERKFLASWYWKWNSYGKFKFNTDTPKTNSATIPRIADETMKWIPWKTSEKNLSPVEKELIENVTENPMWGKVSKDAHGAIEYAMDYKTMEDMHTVVTFTRKLMQDPWVIKTAVNSGKKLMEPSQLRCSNNFNVLWKATKDIVNAKSAQLIENGTVEILPMPKATPKDTACEQIVKHKSILYDTKCALVERLGDTLHYLSSLKRCDFLAADRPRVYTSVGDASKGIQIAFQEYEILLEREELDGSTADPETYQYIGKKIKILAENLPDLFGTIPTPKDRSQVTEHARKGLENLQKMDEDLSTYVEFVTNFTQF